VDDGADVRKTLADILRAMRYAEPLEVEEVPAYLPKPSDSRPVQFLVTPFLDSTKPRPARPVPGA
jgi:hypothetical protein